MQRSPSCGGTERLPTPRAFLDALHHGVPRDIMAQVAPLSDEEGQAARDALGPLLDKYLASTLNKWGVEANAFVFLTTLTMNKLATAKILMSRRAPLVPVPIRSAEPPPPPVPDPPVSVTENGPGDTV